jgi:16S rRNA (adenine1518-N6/adenine1519-N6)-dimethyltransferase
MLILMQKDVGDKIIKWQLKNSEITKKNKNKTSVLSLFIAKKANVREVLFVWKQNFIPAPKVESSVLLFELHNLYNKVEDKEFLDFIKKWFSEPRKKLVKNLLKNW